MLADLMGSHYGEAPAFAGDAAEVLASLPLRSGRPVSWDMHPAAWASAVDCARVTPNQLARLYKSVDVCAEELGQYTEEMVKKIREDHWVPFHLARRGFTNASWKIHEILEALSPRDREVGPRYLDLCGGPGGFVNAMAFVFPVTKGVGCTLRGPDDYWPNLLGGHTKVKAGRLYKSKDGKHEFVSLSAGGGDIFSAAAARAIASSAPYDMVLADGASSDDGWDQEVKSFPLKAREAFLALKSVRPGGHFIWKIFGIRTTRMQKLLAYVIEHFTGWEIMKPQSSRVANAELYVVLTCRANMNSPLSAFQGNGCFSDPHMELASGIRDRLFCFAVYFATRRLVGLGGLLGKCRACTRRAVGPMKKIA